MDPEKSNSKTKLCPVCGTRLNDSATRCLVCGTEFEATTGAKKTTEVRAKRLPEITLSLPAALGLLALFITLATVVVFLVLRPGPTGEEVADITPNAHTTTPSPTITTTSTITLTPTLAPTWTPLPPLEYKVNPGDSCAGVAAAFGVSVQSIILENNLSADCELYEDQVLMVPQPTPTASPQPTATLSDLEKTEAACETINYTVATNDTLSAIADTYDVSMATIREYNGLLNDTVYEGQTLIIPLCLREPTPGPTPTPTPLPPYPGPNLLLPADGTSFTADSDTITLQWAAVGELDTNESYAVTITDLTSENNETIVEYVNETSFIVPSSLLIDDGQPHIFRWFVYIARQVGSDEEDGENWEIAGEKSQERVFSWIRITSD
ncbi:MAG: LysM peptidoglycan-binding domain-containing protein [Chloroflexota bacterium]|nr:LysM peptidoglycan-binding domain-containing protein [Chloroflexota bacterium]